MNVMVHVYKSRKLLFWHLRIGAFHLKHCMNQVHTLSPVLKLGVAIK